MEVRNLTPEEVLFIFQEEHRLFSPWDEEAEPAVQLTMDSDIIDWYDVTNTVQGKELGKRLNELFEINISSAEWEACFSKQLKDVCELIAKHARIEYVKPIKVFGRECLSASLFYQIKNHLSSKGADVTALTPSSPLEPYLKKPHGVLFDFINKNYPGVIPEIKVEKVKYYSSLQTYSWISIIGLIICGLKWPVILLGIPICFGSYYYTTYKCAKIFEKHSGMLYIPGIPTFRHLIEKIIQQKNIDKDYELCIK